jgi:hypothetical protein
MAPDAPCNPEYAIYTCNSGENTYYYASNDGGNTYTLMYDLSEFWFEFQFYDPNFNADIFRQYSINETSTVLTDDGLMFSFPCS